MITKPLSSGDLLADRRATYARMLADDGDVAAAADLMRDALSLAPGWAAGWFRLGEWLKAAGRTAEAVDAWREALRLDPEDRMGALLELELAGGITPARTVPSGFAEALFDEYADRFEASLVGKLGYCAPELLAGAIARGGAATFAHALDLGCGTGLMGERLRAMASFLEGCDVSGRMLARAEAKRIYDRLRQVDLQTLEPSGESVDLVTAADVFIYLGGLDKLFATVAGILSPGGVFAFTVESHDGPEPMALRSSKRYAHSERYIRDVLAASGFELSHLGTEPIRTDRGEPVLAHIVVARKAVAWRADAAPAAQPDEAADPVDLPLN